MLDFMSEAWTELRGPHGHSLIPPMLGSFVASVYYLYNILVYCLIPGTTTDGFNIVAAFVVFVYLVLQFSFGPSILLLCKVVKFGLRLFFDANGLFAIIFGYECIYQFLVALIWGLCVTEAWKTAKSFGSCMRRNNCSETSWFQIPLSIASSCDSALCRRFSYQLNNVFITAVVALINGIMYWLWKQYPVVVAPLVLDNGGPPGPNPPHIICMTPMRCEIARQITDLLRNIERLICQNCRPIVHEIIEPPLVVNQSGQTTTGGNAGSGRGTLSSNRPRRSSRIRRNSRVNR